MESIIGCFAHRYSGRRSGSLDLNKSKNRRQPTAPLAGCRSSSTRWGNEKVDPWCLSGDAVLWRKGEMVIQAVAVVRVY